MKYSPLSKIVISRASVFVRPFGVALLALSCLCLTGCFRVSSDLRALRDGLMKPASADWEENIEVGVGALTLGVARAGLSFVDLPPEARAALDAARGAEVGVYRLHNNGKRVNRAAMLAQADKAMDKAGWDRMVTVMNDHELVVIYVPDTMGSIRNIKVCVVVFDGQQLVLASARSNVEPLLNLALNRPEFRQLTASLSASERN
jgi:hypothetical protein